jgi:hypothetical protein
MQLLNRGLTMIKKDYYIVVCYGVLLLSATFAIAPTQKTAFNPLGHFHIHDVLAHLREMRPVMRELSPGIRPFSHQVILDLHRDMGFKIPAAFAFPLPWVMIELHTEPTASFNRNVIGALEQSTMRMLCGNATFGHIYKYPVYLRVGMDHMPFGRHASNIMPPSMIVTKHPTTSEFLGAAGFDYKFNTAHQLSVLVSHGDGVSYIPLKKRKNACSEGKLFKWKPNLDNDQVHYIFTILNARYQKTSPTSLGFVTFDHLQFGGGIGKKEDNFEVEGETLSNLLLLNFNSDIDFEKYYNCKFEYLRDCGSNKFNITPFALHTEFSINFPTLSIIGWPVPSMITVGYEKGNLFIAEHDKITDIKPISSLFFAGKLELWEKRITLVMGGKLNLVTKKPHPLLRLSCHVL